jgi:hypothetical protein
MPINVRCSNADCRKSLKVKDELAGKKIKCPACGTILTVPSAEEEPAPPPRKPPTPAAPKQKGVVFFEDEEEEEEEEAPRRKPAPPPRKKAARPVDEDEEELEEDEPPPRRPAKGSPPPKKKAPPRVEDEEDLEDEGEYDEEERPRSRRRGPEPPPRRKARPVDEDEDQEEDWEEEPAEEGNEEDYGGVSAAETGLDKLTLIFMFSGIGALVLMAVGVFLPWVSLDDVSITGIKMGFRAILILVLAPAAAAGIGVMFAIKKPVVLPSLAALVPGDYGFTLLLFVIIRGGAKIAGIGIWVGLVASLAASVTLSFVAIRTRRTLPWVDKKCPSNFLAEHGAFIGAHVLGLLLGVLLSFIGTAAAVSTEGPGGYPP